MEFRVKKPLYKVGDNVYVHIRATQNCYLNIFDITSENEFSQLIPSHFIQTNLLQKDASYTIPGRDDEFDWEVSGPQGTEYLFAVCTVKNVRFLPSNIKDGTSLSPQEFKQILLRSLEAIPSDEWTMASTQFLIGRKP